MPKSRWGRNAVYGGVLYAAMAFLGYLTQPTPEEIAAEEARLAKIAALAQEKEAKRASQEAEWEVVRQELEAEEAARPKMNATNFNRIREGMTYDEVIAIVGPPSELLSSSEFSGIRTQVYMWKVGVFSGANANAMFQDGKMVSKAQFGL